jgi:predicted DNA-binding transcriptional regulator YafY
VLADVGRQSRRTLRPLACSSGARRDARRWCELRNDFRNFRLDRVTSAQTIGKPFRDEPGKTLRDMLAKYGPDAVRMLD